MESIFSTQNLQTFLRRKNLRPPPPGPLGRPPGGRPPGPEEEGPEPSGRDVLGALGVLVSSAIIFYSFSGPMDPVRPLHPGRTAIAWLKTTAQKTV
jgi:hypothetical protein